MHLQAGILAVPLERCRAGNPKQRTVIEQIVADGKKYDIARDSRLPPNVRNLALDFVALSLVAPEKNRYRFKVEGWDSDWREAVNESRVEYTNLPPRNYRFLVIASNNSGVWNTTGDSLDFCFSHCA